MKNKFNINDKIVGGGKIYGMVSPSYAYAMWLKKLGFTSDDDPELYPAHPWDEKHPNWHDEPVYYITFPNPKPVCSFEEFKEQNPHIKEEHLQQEYGKVPRTRDLSLPEAAVVVDEDLDSLCDKLFSGEKKWPK